MAVPTVELTRKRLETLKCISGDHEAAHSFEDDLYREFVKAIADEGGPHSEAAQELLKTQDIDFVRYCA